MIFHTIISFFEFFYLILKSLKIFDNILYNNFTELEYKECK